MAKRGTHPPQASGDADDAPHAPSRAASVKQDDPMQAGEKPAPDRQAILGTTQGQHERAAGNLLASFGASLRAARLKLGLKQADVAIQTGLPQQYLSTIEAGQQNITLKTMALLAGVVGEDVADMLRPTRANAMKK